MTPFHTRRFSQRCHRKKTNNGSKCILRRELNQFNLATLNPLNSLSHSIALPDGVYQGVHCQRCHCAVRQYHFPHQGGFKLRFHRSRMQQPPTINTALDIDITKKLAIGWPGWMVSMLSTEFNQFNLVKHTHRHLHTHTHTKLFQQIGQSLIHVTYCITYVNMMALTESQ